jgi:hypothetical protein
VRTTLVNLAEGVLAVALMVAGTVVVIFLFESERIRRRCPGEAP